MELKIYENNGMIKYSNHELAIHNDAMIEMYEQLEDELKYKSEKNKRLWKRKIINNIKEDDIML